MDFKEAMKAEMDEIMETFAEYLKTNPYIDIVYSEKFGYISLHFEEGEPEGAVQIPTPRRMLDVLFEELVNDVIFAPGHEHAMDGNLTEQEQEGVRRHLSCVLADADEIERRYYRASLEMYLENYPRGFYFDD